MKVSVTINDEYTVSPLYGYAIGEPTLYTNQVTIPGRHGVLDYSTALTGVPTYQNRQIQFAFGIIGKAQERDTVYNTFYNAYYGQDITLQFSNLDGYFSGKVTSITKSTEYICSTVTVSVDCYPFRTLDDGSEEL